MSMAPPVLALPPRHEPCPPRHELVWVTSRWSGARFWHLGTTYQQAWPGGSAAYLVMLCGHGSLSNRPYVLEPGQVPSPRVWVDTPVPRVEERMRCPRCIAARNRRVQRRRRW